MTATAESPQVGDNMILRLPSELRVKIYELHLIQPGRALQPNGFEDLYEDIYEEHFKSGERVCSEEHQVFPNILQTCRTIYNEAIPILYGKNTLAFHDTNWTTQIMPFPKHHLSLVKHIKVAVNPVLSDSVRRMANFLRVLTGPEISLTNLSVHIHTDFALERYDFDEDEPPYPWLLYTDRLLTDRDPIVRALFALTSVNKLYIWLVDHARYDSGGPDDLRTRFQESAAARGYSIVIEERCADPHDPCRRCDQLSMELEEGMMTCEYSKDLSMWWNEGQSWDPARLPEYESSKYGENDIDEEESDREEKDAIDIDE